MVTALVCNVGLKLSQSAMRLLVAVRAFNLARQLTAESACLADTLSIELWALVASVLIVNEKVLQPKVKAAASTRAGFDNGHFLDDAEHKPQPAHLVPLH